MKPRILFIVPLPPPVHGSSMMCDFIRKSEYINKEFKCDFVNLSTSRSMTEIGNKSPKKLFRFFYSYLNVVYKLCTKRYDTCYLAITCHGTGLLKDAPFAMVCKLFGKKLVIHQHNKGMNKDVDKPCFSFLLRSVYKNAKVILLSERLYPDISRIVDRSQVRICPNGIPAIKRHPKRVNPVPRLLFLSNLIESKGVLVLLDACKILKDKGYAFSCDFIGNETKEIDARRFEKEVVVRGLGNTIHYIGPKYHGEKHKELAKSDIFVFPTYYDNECFPLVLLEAMQAGLPCISTEEGAIPDIISETGLIVPPQSAEKMADAIELLINDKDLRLRLSQEAYRVFNSRYTLQDFESRIVQILHE